MRAVVRWAFVPRIAVRLAVLAVLLLALVVAAMTVTVTELAAMRSWIGSLGVLAPVMFALVYALVVPVPVPKGVLCTAAGLAFGLPLGAAVVVAGGTAGATAAFLIARWLGRDAVVGLAPGHVQRVDAVIERHGVPAALMVRLVPLLPFTLLNYACGVTVMKLRHYLLGTAVGIVPGSTAMVALGSLGGVTAPWAPVAISLGLGTATLAVGAARHLRRHAGLPPAAPGVAIAVHRTNAPLRPAPGAAPCTMEDDGSARPAGDDGDGREGNQA